MDLNEVSKGSRMTTEDGTRQLHKLLSEAVEGDQPAAEDRDPYDIVIYHIGGDGGYGPVRDVIDRFEKNCLLVIFDIRDDTDEVTVSSAEVADSGSGVRKLFVNIGIGSEAGTSPFHINKFPLSSSMYPPSPGVVDDHVLFLAHVPPHEPITTWGQNTELASRVEVDVVTIDDVVESGIAPPPDIISMDIQGAEYAAFLGGTKAISDSVLCTVSEIEYFEIYAGQGMFADQIKLLTENGFRLVDVLNQQWWWTGEASGKGFLTVGEAIFFRLPETGFPGTASSEEVFPKLAKLLGIAYAFERYSFSNKIIATLESDYPDEFRDLQKRPEFDDAINHYRWVQDHKEDYKKDNHFFLEAERKAARTPLSRTVAKALWHSLPYRLRYELRYRRRGL